MEDIELDLGNVSIGHDVDTRRFAAAFFSEDDIGVVIRCHFEVERAAIRSLDTLTGGRWRKVRPRYLSEHLNLLEMIGVPPKILAPARTLNNLRNSFAHNGFEELSEENLIDLLRAVRAFLPKFTDDFELRIHGKREFCAKFQDCSIRQRYVATSATLVLVIGGLPEIMKAYWEKIKRGPSASSC